MTLQIRQAQRNQAKPLIGLYAESGAGKTYSALQLARGFVGPKGKIVMIETESGRGEAHVDSIPGGFEVISLREDFSSRTFGEAISLAESSKPDALIIDSASHEWEGIGGVLHAAAENEAAGKKGMQVWQKPKIDHQRHFTGRLLQTPIPIVIVCMRAKYPMKEVKNAKGFKDMVRSEQMEPKQSEDILFEMFVHGWIDRDRHAFHATKYTRPDLAQIIKSGEPISIATGEALAKWAAGGATPAKQTGVNPLLNDVLTAIETARNIGELNAASKAAKELPENERAVARDVYKIRKQQLDDVAREAAHDIGDKPLSDDEANRAAELAGEK